jgi:hypothetical protein
MEGGSTPLPVRGLAVALVLGMLLAVAFVGVFARIPASVELTGASQKASTSNQTTLPETNVTNSGTSSVTSGTNSSVAAIPYFLGNSSNSLPIGAVSEAISPAPASNSTNSTGGSSFQYANLTPTLASEQRSAVAAAGWRDILLFATAGALALAAFLVVRRQAS